MSPALTGTIAGHYSFATAFSVLSAIALVAVLLWWRVAHRPGKQTVRRVGHSRHPASHLRQLVRARFALFQLLQVTQRGF
jgi:cyanate permease